MPKKITPKEGNAAEEGTAATPVNRSARLKLVEFLAAAYFARVDAETQGAMAILGTPGQQRAGALAVTRAPSTDSSGNVDTGSSRSVSFGRGGGGGAGYRVAETLSRCDQGAPLPRGEDHQSRGGGAFR